MKVYKTMHGEGKAQIEHQLSDTRFLRLSAMRNHTRLLVVKATCYTLDGNFEVFSPSQDYSKTVAALEVKRITAKTVETTLQMYLPTLQEHVDAAKKHYNIQ